MKAPTEIRKKDVKAAAILIILCLLISGGLYFGWLTAVMGNMKKLSEEIKTVQSELARATAAREKVRTLSEKVRKRDEEIKRYESLLPEEGTLPAIYEEIYNIANEYRLSAHLERQEPALLDKAVLKAVCEIKLSGHFNNLLKFIQHFEGKDIPVYFTDIKLKPLSPGADSIEGLFKMIIYTGKTKL